MREVLDASALLALAQSEPGADVVAEALENAVISTVNFSEVVAKLAEKGYPREAIEEEMRSLHLTIERILMRSRHLPLVCCGP